MGVSTNMCTVPDNWLQAKWLPVAFGFGPIRYLFLAGNYNVFLEFNVVICRGKYDYFI